MLGGGVVEGRIVRRVGSRQRQGSVGRSLARRCPLAEAGTYHSSRCRSSQPTHPTIRDRWPSRSIVRIRRSHHPRIPSHFHHGTRRLGSPSPSGARPPPRRCHHHLHHRHHHHHRPRRFGQPPQPLLPVCAACQAWSGAARHRWARYRYGHTQRWTQRWRGRDASNLARGSVWSGGHSWSRRQAWW